MKKIAIICNYALMPERIGGMDYFFWMYADACKKNDISVDWFFPNASDHGNYPKMKIIAFGAQSPESFFLDFCKIENPGYNFVITHFIELCTPFFRKLAKISNAKIIAIDHNPRPIGGYPLRKKIEKRIKGILFSRHIDQFIGVSDYTSNAILNDFGAHLRKKTITIYNGIQTAEIRQRLIRNLKNPSFLVASHLRESKGIQDLIAAVAQLQKATLPKLKIDIYGEGSV
ncbi:glycosyltransferase family 4 protein [Flavobacterium sp. 3HN19-14]|uniref:glycosyltransferase family 4 protein n=1 Tax=Flavobacterium sp. 3HN19-14 TaxID=3448133 RepID=UPI003EDEA469